MNLHVLANLRVKNIPKCAGLCHQLPDVSAGGESPVGGLLFFRLDVHDSARSCVYRGTPRDAICVDTPIVLAAQTDTGCGLWQCLVLS
jgi:hypothetical protein